MQGIDPDTLGERLKEVRKKRHLTLKQVFDQTGISVATLSRIERGGLKSLKSDTLMTLTDWLGLAVEAIKKEPPRVSRKGQPVVSTPDIVELHLRADKNLNQQTASALSKLFRTVYEQLAEQMKKE